MKTRQHRAQILSFENGDPQEWIAFITKNSTLLQGFILHFSTPIDTAIQELCRSFGLLYTIGTLPNKPNTESMRALDSVFNKQARAQPKQPNQATTHPCTLIHKIRSGEEITLEDNAVVIGDIAHGANIYAKQTLIVFGDCAGTLRVDGEFFILRNLTSGYIIFQAGILPEPIIAKINANSRLKIIIKSSDTIVVKEII